MKSLILCLLGAAGLAAAEPPPAPDSAFLDGFVGGTWVAALAVPAGGPARSIELVFTVPPSHAGFHVESTQVAGGTRRPYVSGMYAWDAAARKFQIFYTDSAGSLTSGAATVAGAALLHDLVEVNADGSVDHVRVKLTRVGPNEFTNEISLLQDQAYVPIAGVRYVRTPAAAHQP